MYVIKRDLGSLHQLFVVHMESETAFVDFKMKQNQTQFLQL